MRTTIIACGRLRPPFADDVEHYAKLLSRYTQLEVIELRDDKTLNRRLPARAYLCVLDRSGREFASVDFARQIGELRDLGRELCFVLGGAKGIDAKIERKPDLVLSFGELTLPFQLARVVLMEQLYRAHKILAGEPYHY